MVKIDHIYSHLGSGFKIVIAAATLLSAISADAAPSITDDMVNAAVEGKPYLDMRYRYEFADQANAPDSAHASTLRTKLGYKSGEFYKTKIGVEVENVAVLSVDDYYNSGVNNKSNYAYVPDPDTTDLNQLYVELNQLQDTTIKAGRQVIALDNERFVGDDSWRQKDRTYDAVGLTNTSIPNLTGYYGYIFNINTPFGHDAPNGDWASDVHLFNVKYDALPCLKPVVYTYLMNIKDNSALSNKTFGGNVSGDTDLIGDARANYSVEYAMQSDYGDNPNNYSADYYNFTGGLDVFGFNFKGGIDVIGAGNGTGFQFPLGTSHSYNGWADFDYLTPLSNGLKDISFSTGYKLDLPVQYLDNIMLLTAYHRYKEAKGGADIGNEIDFQAKKTFFENYTATIKYADFDANEATSFTDVQKAWLVLGAKF